MTRIGGLLTNASNSSRNVVNSFNVEWRSYLLFNRIKVSCFNNGIIRYSLLLLIAMSIGQSSLENPGIG